MICNAYDSAIILLYNGRDGVVTDSNGLLYMRARYYSPDLKRFVNADIIAGVITDPVTLNRYAYANGNPVSNIDPFGLSAERGNNSFNSKLQSKFKDIKNKLLYLENMFKESLFGKLFQIPESVIERNYIHNKNNDIVNQLINNQNVSGSDISKMVLIDQGMNFNGCEVIAVNNALYLMGYEPSMAELVRIFEENDVVVGNDFIDGYFGSNPFGLDRIFDAVGVDSHEVSVNDLSQRGLYIISFWNSTDYDSMLHTIAMQSDGKGNYITYNNAYDDIDRNFPINNNNLYIIGYKLFPRKLINI